MRNRQWLIGSCAAVVSMAASSVAMAQAQPAAAGATADTGIAEIVVTAQKRAQKSQDVPVSISAFTATQLSDLEVRNVTDLGTLTPGLVLTAQVGVTPFLRGVGNDATTVGNESSVAVYLDDVYEARLDPAVLELADIERVEVLKGPQGTLFGRNASGGLIGIYTRNPTQDPTAEVTLGFDNYQTQLAKVFVAGGITDNITADLSVLHSYQGEGWGRNFATGLKFGYENYDVLRTKWLFDLADDTKFRLIASYDHSKGDYGMGTNIYPGTAGGIFPFYQPTVLKRLPVGFYDTNNFYQNSNREEGFSVSGRLDHDFGFATFASITSFRNDTENVSTSDTGSYIHDANVLLITRDRTFTQEFQLSSEKGSAFDWITGFYYLNAFGGYEPSEFYGPPVGLGFLGGAFGPCPECQLNITGTQRIRDYAEYGQATFHVTDDTNITAGLRYTIDELTGYGQTQAFVPGIGAVTFPGTATERTTFYKPTYKFSLDHHFTPDVMAYVSYSRGFKSGTYNTLPLGPTPASPEVLDATEIGVKSDLFDRRLQLNGSFFYYQIHNPQVQTVINSAVNIVNAGAAEIKGIDLDGQYEIMPGLLTHFGGEFLDAHYTSYKNAPLIVPTLKPPYGTIGPVAADASGNDLVRAPRFSLNAGLNYSLSTSFGLWEFVGNYSWSSGFFWDPDNINRQHSYGLLDASIIYSLPDNEQWDFKLYGKNLTAQKYMSSELEQGGIAGDRYYPGAPTTFGFEITYKFEGEAEPAAAAAPYTPPPAEAPAQVARSYMVFFDFNKSDLTSEAVSIVDQAAKNAAPAKATTLTVTGHTDTVGSDAYNMRLGRRRAEAVASELEKQGISASEIQIVSKGKRDLLVPTRDGVREPQNRRVTVVYDGGTTS